MYPHASISKKSLTLSQILFSRKITSKEVEKAPECWRESTYFVLLQTQLLRQL
ncbi:hypothetical protein JN06_01028 [Bacteroides zoogleoformans]|nr:hypothetical protein JN06_01028 [Bacteroides zoogleoformans]